MAWWPGISAARIVIKCCYVAVSLWWQHEQWLVLFFLLLLSIIYGELGRIPATHTPSPPTHTHTPSYPRRWEVLSLLLLHLHVHHYINLLVCLIFQNPSLCIWFYEPSGWRNGRTHERLLSELQLVMRGDFTSAALFCMWSSHYVNVMLRMQWPSNFQNGSKILIVEKICKQKCCNNSW